MTLIKDLNLKGTNFTAKRGTAVRGISLVVDNPEQIEGRVNAQQIVIPTRFVKKSNGPIPPEDGLLTLRPLPKWPFGRNTPPLD